MPREGRKRDLYHHAKTCAKEKLGNERLICYLISLLGKSLRNSSDVDIQLHINVLKIVQVA
jgi:hypothetical protein